jgi:hypothetical protein
MPLNYLISNTLYIILFVEDLWHFKKWQLKSESYEGTFLRHSEYLSGEKGTECMQLMVDCNRVVKTNHGCAG